MIFVCVWGGGDLQLPEPPPSNLPLWGYVSVQNKTQVISYQ